MNEFDGLQTLVGLFHFQLHRFDAIPTTQSWL
jgi:hypothetical protein